MEWLRRLGALFVGAHVPLVLFLLFDLSVLYLIPSWLVALQWYSIALLLGTLLILSLVWPVRWVLKHYLTSPKPLFCAVNLSCAAIVVLGFALYFFKQDGWQLFHIGAVDLIFWGVTAALTSWIYLDLERMLQQRHSAQA